MADEGPPLPSNYVTILHLKERWLKQQQQQKSSKSNPNPHESLSVKPKHDFASASASKISNESGYHRTNRPPIINQLKHNVTPHDFASKTPNDSSHRIRNHHVAINQPKPVATVHDSASKTVVQVPDNHQTVEKQKQKQKHNTDESNPKSSKTKNNSKKRNPRFVTDQISTGGSTTLSEPEPEPEPEHVPEKKQHRNRGRRRNQNQEVRQPKSKTTAVARNLDDSSRNDSAVVEAVSTAAAVKEINITDVSQKNDRRRANEGFNGRWRTGHVKDPVGVKKGQTMTTVWVRKGESVPK